MSSQRLKVRVAFARLCYTSYTFLEPVGASTGFFLGHNMKFVSSPMNTLSGWDRTSKTFSSLRVSSTDLNRPRIFFRLHKH
jgi:hypothetical protein